MCQKYLQNGQIIKIKCFSWKIISFFLNLNKIPKAILAFHIFQKEQCSETPRRRPVSLFYAIYGFFKFKTARVMSEGIFPYNPKIRNNSLHLSDIARFWSNIHIFIFWFGQDGLLLCIYLFATAGCLPRLLSTSLDPLPPSRQVARICWLPVFFFLYLLSRGP